MFIPRIKNTIPYWQDDWPGFWRRLKAAYLLSGNNNMAERGIRHLAMQRIISTYFDKGISYYFIVTRNYANLKVSKQIVSQI